MAVKSFKLEVVKEPTLRIWHSYFDPMSFGRCETEKFIKLKGLKLTKPIRGPKGGFRSARLLDANGKVVWVFGASEQGFYDAVEHAIKSFKEAP